MNLVSEKNNFLYLTVGMVLLLFVGAISDQFEGMVGHQLVQAFSVINIAIGIYGFRSEKMWFHSKIGITALIISIVVIGVILELLHLYYLHLILLFCFYIWAIWLAGRQVLFSGAVDMNRIVGAICIYLLMGLIWTLMYLFIAQAIPGAFNGVEQMVWYDNFADVAYYSYVTLTTLGYGDISPVAPIARFLVYMEAVVGVFYMAILVASLIGVGISESNKH
ncbi:MAG: two pore domain potassium channel family protein [Gammaproteobacteria bacterium]|nr:MAG: two pore domain potassium channel family protein [Gammaproteobacteria bacterium]